MVSVCFVLNLVFINRMNVKNATKRPRIPTKKVQEMTSSPPIVKETSGKYRLFLCFKYVSNRKGGNPGLAGLRPHLMGPNLCDRNTFLH